MTDLEKMELALRRVIADNKHRPFETPIQMLQRFADELVTVKAAPGMTGDPVRFVTLPIDHPLLVAVEAASKLFRSYEAEHERKARGARIDEASDRLAKARRNGEAAEALERAFRDWCHG